MKAIGYVRGTEADLQKSSIKKYCEANDLELEKIFIDDIASGLSDDREQYQELFKYISENEVDFVIVYKAEKFHRDMKKLIDAILELDEKNISFIATNQKTDISRIIKELY
jgi:DNA invertase Pin-like site-specific DNA recombinase